MNVLGGMLTQCFIAKKIPLLIVAKMKHHFCGRHAILEGNMQFLEREKLDPYRLKLPLLYRHIIDFSELVMPTGIGAKRSQTTDGAIAYKLG
jgi:hypothetical protein